jgi:Cys-tRNA synthase (O-phospho-L-seryl-tRNA:Cys-tRNA synthase)
MAGFTLEIAKKHLDAWLTAELEVTASQSYSIGSRSLTKANLPEIRKQIQYWKNEVEKLENISKRKGRNRVTRVVPRDL